MMSYYETKIDDCLTTQNYTLQKQYGSKLAHNKFIIIIIINIINFIHLLISTQFPSTMLSIKVKKYLWVEQKLFLLTER